MNAFSQTKYCLCAVVCGYFVMNFWQRTPFYQVHRRFRGGPLWHFEFEKIFPSQIFCFKLPHLYRKRIFGKRRSLGTLSILYPKNFIAFQAKLIYQVLKGPRLQVEWLYEILQNPDFGVNFKSYQFLMQRIWCEWNVKFIFWGSRTKIFTENNKKQE